MASMTNHNMRELLNRHLEQFADEAFAGQKKYRFGRNLRYGNSSSPGIAVNTTDGTWFDHYTNEGGDCLKLITTRLSNGNFADAVRVAKQFLNHVGHITQEPAVARKQPPKMSTLSSVAKNQYALALWGKSLPLATSPGSYRCLPEAIDVEITDIFSLNDLRFNLHSPRGRLPPAPALIALMRDPRTGDPTGIHRTFLHNYGTRRLNQYDDCGPARMLLGQKGVICLSGFASVTTGLHLAEGIEAAIAGMVAGYLPMWACVDAGSMKSFPALPGIECITIFADHDDNKIGQKAAHTCAQRQCSFGKEAIIKIPNNAGEDLDDIVRRING